MLFDVVREFVALSGSGGVRGRSLDRARELMVVLRRAGFDSAEISLLSGGRWPAGNIRTYSRGWGGVDDSLVMEKEGIMASLRGLASSGMGVGDVDVVLALDRSVKAKGSSLEEVAELNGHLGDFGIKPGEVGELVKLSRDLKLAPLTPGAVKDWMAVDEKLAAEGFSKELRGFILAIGKKYGVSQAMVAFREFDDLFEIRGERTRLEGDVKRLKSEVGGLEGDKRRLNGEISQRNAMINAVNSATLMGFNVASLAMISALSKKLGGPYKVAEAIQKYASLKAVDEDLEARKAELEKVKGEITEKARLNTALRSTLEEAQREYTNNLDVQLVVELLVNPRGFTVDRLEVAHLLARVLESGAQRIEVNAGLVELPSPILEAAVADMRRLANRLRSLGDVKPGGP
jgi:hypothetical protein